MPTFSAANHLRAGHRKTLLPTKFEMMRPVALTVVDDHGDLKDEVKVILDQIAAFDCVLSAGHLHISEIWPLFEEAKRRGVTRLLVNHPTFVLGCSMTDIAELAGMGAMIEHSMCMFIETRFKHYTAEELREVIDAASVDRTILGSDLGQVNNPTPVEGFREVIKLCLSIGYTPADIRKMISSNACRLVGLDPAVPAQVAAAQ
jgi:hypothetical protein